MRCFILGFLSAPTLDVRAGEQSFSLVAAKECRPRGGLPNFLMKARTPGAPVKVAYLGGSITDQPGWRPKTIEITLSRDASRRRSFLQIQGDICGDL
jgi:hypothetical protein